MRSVFELKVRGGEGNTCFFLLMWSNRRNDLSVTLPYPQELHKRYQRWRQRYFRFYEFETPSGFPESGSLELLTEDAANNLIEAQEGMLTAFLRWLGEGEVRKIQERIWQELTVLAQKASKTGEGYGIDLFLSCDGELARFPWEAWSLTPQGSPAHTVRLIRTTPHPPEGIKPPRSNKRFRKPRILTILGADRRLGLDEDLQALRSLRTIATIVPLDWQAETPKASKQAIAQTLMDDRGWEILFFAGHSDETQYTGGRLELSSEVSLAIGELEDPLMQAQKNGLRLAIFNSCNGLSIATRLVDLGLQVVVMREPIHDEVARTFLIQFCQQLSFHKDVLEALSIARQYLASQQFAFPSVHLVPSFFSPWNAEPVRIEPYGWRYRFQQLLPTKREAIAIALGLFCSVLVPLQEVLLETRMLAQAIYRDLTQQLPQTQQPPILLISVDRESLNKADSEIEQFTYDPIDREYLGKLIQKLTELNARTIGIDYLLDLEEPKQEKLVRALENSIKAQQTWFVFVADKGNYLNEEVANPKWSLQGDSFFWFWDVMLPKNPTCSLDVTCPFSYRLWITHQLNRNSSLVDFPQPNLQSEEDLQEQIESYLDPEKPEVEAIIKQFEQAYPPLGLRSIIDFSVPTKSIYETIPAWQLLEQSIELEQQYKFNQSIVIIAAGGYEKYIYETDNHSLPYAIGYRCNIRRLKSPSENCDRKFTGGEIHAYIAHHLLTRHRLILIPNLWLVILAIVLGKWATLSLYQKSYQKRQKSLLILGGTSIIYAVIGLQLYVSASLILPWFLPLGVFWLYLYRLFRRKTT